MEAEAAACGRPPPLISRMAIGGHHYTSKSAMRISAYKEPPACPLRARARVRQRDVNGSLANVVADPESPPPWEWPHGSVMW